MNGCGAELPVALCATGAHGAQGAHQPPVRLRGDEQDGCGHEGAPGRHLQDGAQQDLQDRWPLLTLKSLGSGFKM